MKKTIVLKFLKHILSVTILMIIAFNGFGQIVFAENFIGDNDGGIIHTSNSSGSSPVVTYLSNDLPTTVDVQTATGSAGIDSENRLKFGRSNSAALNYVSASANGFAAPNTSFNTILSANEQTVTWCVNIMYDRATYLTGAFGAGQLGCGVILACDKADPTDSDARGYGVFLLRGYGSEHGTNNSLNLIYFTKGISEITNSTVADSHEVLARTARGLPSGQVALDLNLVQKYIAFKVVYSPTANTWKLSLRADEEAFTSPLTGTFTDLLPAVSNPGTSAMPYFAFVYSCAATSKNDAFFDNFTVYLGDIATTPVQLINFKAEDDNGKVKLGWQTTSERNNSHFDILRYASVIGVSEKLGQVESKGNSDVLTNYIYTDTRPLEGVNYYQLRQVDFDGKITLSNIINVKRELSLRKFNVYQLGDRNYVASIYSEESAIASLCLSDVNGRILSESNAVLDSGENQIVFSKNVLSPGLYLLSLNVKGDKNMQRKKFLVNR